MNKDEALKLANSKIEHEHSRWNTWVIFFFGSLVSTFTVWGQFKDIIPSYAPWFFCAVLSFIWVFVALGMRRVSLSWVKVINVIETENCKDFKPNKLYNDFEKHHDFYKDFFCDFSLFKVTKVLTYAGVVFFILFIFLGCFIFIHPTEKTNPIVEIEDLTKMVNNIQIITQQVDNINQKIFLLEGKLDSLRNKVEEYNKTNSVDAKSRAAH
jgi:amino acid transporter